MKGTEKQIKWAMDIKAVLENQFAALVEKHGPAPEAVRKYMNEVLSHEEAKYYIDTWKNATRKGFDLLKVLNEETPEEVGEAAFEWACI